MGMNSTIFAGMALNTNGYWKQAIPTLLLNCLKEKNEQIFMYLHK